MAESSATERPASSGEVQALAAETAQMLASEVKERSWLNSAAVWAIIGSASSVLTGLMTIGVVIVGIQQVQVSRELSIQSAAFTSWNELNEASLANPELACPNTDAKLQALLTTPDPKSALGGTYRDRYTAYGNLMITTFEQVMDMAPDDPYWRFRVAERVRCNAPAIRYLQRDGTYGRRYSCRLRQLIAGVLAQAPPTCQPGVR